MAYSLGSYGNFDAEQAILNAAAKKKIAIEKHIEFQENATLLRIKTIKGYYLRMSWNHKKQYILSIFKEITYFETRLRIINYISTLYGKMAAYAEVTPKVKTISQQVLVDHDRSLDKRFLKETACEDIKWIITLSKSNQLNLVMDLLAMGGGGLIRKIYVPLVSIYNRKLLADKNRLEETGHEPENTHLEDLLRDEHLDDSTKYPQDHPLSVEVEKMRKKWDEMIEKSCREVFGYSKSGRGKDVKQSDKDKVGKLNKSKATVKAKTTAKVSTQKHAEKGGESDTVDWIQVLPIWIVKHILDYLDQKTLQNMKKVNPYWSYACESILKERQARKFLNESIVKMRNNVDPQILKQRYEDSAFVEKLHGSSTKPREKKFMKLIHRGAILKQMVPKVKESQQTRLNLLTSVRRDVEICMPLDKVTIFPRLIKEDLLLYKAYPGFHKDVNIFIGVLGDVRRQRNTLSYTLSQQLTDMFSMSEATLEDW